MEVIVVLAVIAALGALLTPIVIGYIDDAKKAQAAHDTQIIASAILRMFSDTGKLPFKRNGTGTPAKASGDADILFTAAGNAVSTDNDTSTGDTWTASSLVTDTIENQLIENKPFALGPGAAAYPTTGRFAWRGPYLDTPKADPWGRKFYVNIGKGDPAAASPKAVFVISAGPNGQLETSADQAAATALTPVGDDIIARVK